MKAMNIIIKVLTALAAVAGVVYVIATYGDKIVAWAKNLLNNCPCKKDFVEVPEAEEEAPAEEVVEEVPAEEAPVEEVPVEETPVEEAPAEEPPVEEAPVDETVVEATEADFEG